MTRVSSLVTILVVSLAATTSLAGTDRRFVTETNSLTLGQAMDWLTRDHVVWHEAVGRDEDADGKVNTKIGRYE